MSAQKPGSFRTYERVIRERVQRVVSDSIRRASGDTSLSVGAITTGIEKWDKNGGVERGILTVVGASTGAGKSIIKLQLASAAARAGKRVLILDFEDPEGKTADRTLANITKLDSQDISLGRLDDMDILRIRAAEEKAAEWAVNVDYLGDSLTGAEVRATLARSEHDLVLVDYIQGVPDEPGYTTERTIANLAWDLNKHAQKRKAAVVVMSQLKNEVDERGANRMEWSQRRGQKPDISGYRPGPGPNDLAWSSALAQRAKTIVYWWRPGQWEAKFGLPNAKDNRGELIFSKSNFGREGSFLIGFNGKTATVGDYNEE